MAVSPAKKTASKATVKKSAQKKPAATKTPAAKTTTAKTSTTKVRKISAEERYKMIEVAAYYIAEHNHFQGSAIDFWIAAEQEVNKKIA
jgi:DTW domain-containing protein YfiP